MTLYDSRFMFRHDNPFETNDNKDHLKKYLAAHADKYTVIDYLNDSRYLLLATDVTKLFNIEVEDIGISRNPIMTRIKRFLLNVPGLSTELMEWSKDVSAAQPLPITGDSDIKINKGSSEEEFKVSTLLGTRTTFSSITSNTTYDISSEHLLTYQELRVLSINIAKGLLNAPPKDETITLLEGEKRRSLITEIQEYKRIKEFSALDEDLQKMTLEQLESYRDMCEKMLNKFKVDNILSSSFNLCAMGYGTVFPDGIPIGNSRLQFGNVGKEIREHFLDNRTPTGFSFARLLSKYDLTISDELMIIITAGELFLKNMKFTSPPKEQTESSKQNVVKTKINNNNNKIVPLEITADSDDDDDELNSID
jgi:hypothetical protein